MNNDLSTGIPEELKDVNTPIYPSLQAGWHARLKSHHFVHTNDLMRDFATIVNLDPWMLTCHHTALDDINVNQAQNREQLADAAADLFRRIQLKYDEHGITEKPFVFLKADSGTYGMGVMAIEDPAQIVRLSSRQRSKLYKGKGGQVISRYLLQEGVPSVHKVCGQVGEVCVYQIANQFVGGFYRVHGERSARESLNARGMEFATMCPHSDHYGACGAHANNTMFDVYRILARIAGIAASHEIAQLEAAAGVSP